jgi:hypothetical protein
MYKTKEQASAYARQWYLENKERIRTEDNREKRNEAVRNWRKNHPERNIFTAAKARAKRLGYEFNIELSDIIIPDVCPILNIPLRRIENTQHNNAPALDRIDNTKGYIKGNIQIISHKANRHKADLSLQEIHNLYLYSLRAAA